MKNALNAQNLKNLKSEKCPKFCRIFIVIIFLEEIDEYWLENPQPMVLDHAISEYGVYF